LPIETMSEDPTKTALLELLRESKECATFLGELGVETVSLRPATESAGFKVQPEQPSSIWRAAAKSIERPAQDINQALPVRKAGSPLQDSASLFGDLAPLTPTLAPSAESLEEIWSDIGDCTRCGLCEGRTQVVNTHGNRQARLMFVGEAPGADEDAQGKPFVGRAGQLLTKMIEAMGLKREDVIIGNVNRCRPPGNRQPTLEEAAICRPFLFREISSIQPEVIVVMGNTALRNLLESREGITRARGQFQDFRGIKVMPTFHPAYLLRDPSKKRETWEDLKKVMEYLNLNLKP
jgi:uracil-DNA glycosylase